jgi:hypothetical protein
MTFSPTFLKRQRCLMPLPQRVGILGTKLNVLGSSISRVGRTWFGRLIDAGTLGYILYEEVQYEAQVLSPVHSRNSNCPTRTGFNHTHSAILALVSPWPHRPLLASGRLANGHS